jgi:hypothetical protein
MAKIPRIKIHWTVVELNVSITRNIRSILLMYFAYVRALWVDGAIGFILFGSCKMDGEDSPSSVAGRGPGLVGYM